MILTRATLDKSQCMMPGCTHTSHDGPLVLGSGCHPKAKLGAAYQGGVLVLTCGRCGAKVAEVMVAP